MKNIFTTLVALALIFVLASPANAQTPLNGPQGGTGVPGIFSGSIPFGGSSLLRMATSSAFSYNNSLARLTVTNASTTNLSAAEASTSVLTITALKDSTQSLGSSGYVLQSNGSVATWVATSTLGLGGAGGGTVNSVDMSVPTGFAISGNPVTTSGTLALSFAAGYGLPLTASTTNWNNFYTTPSTRITDGTNLTWSGNTLNVDDPFSVTNFTATNATSTTQYATNYYGSGQNLTLARTGASTYSTLQHLQNIFHSAGYVSGGTISDAGGGVISVAAGTGLIRDTNSSVAEISYFDWTASTTIPISNNTYRYIGVEYNAGSPRIVSHTSYDWNFKTDFPLGNVVNTNNTIHIENSPFAVGDHAANMIRRDIETMPYERDMMTGGLILGETGTRNVTVSAGAVWQGLTRHEISAIDTSGANSFTTWAYNGTSWNSTTSVTQWPNTQYNDITSGLVNMTAGRYANLWFYLETDGGLHMVYGRAQYNNLAAAEAGSVPPTVPDKISVHSWLIGRIIFQTSAASASEIQSVYTQTFTATAASNHANLSNLAWTSSGHTGTASTIAGFNGSGAASEYTTTGTGNVVLSASPTLTGTATFANYTATNGTTTNATSTMLAVTTSFNFLGDFITNVLTWFDSKIELLSNVIAAASSVWDFGAATSFEIPNGTNPSFNATGTIAYDETDKQLLVGTSTSATPGVIRIVDTIAKFKVPSTSPMFATSTTTYFPTEQDGYTVTNIFCSVEGGTSKIITVFGESITCDIDGQADDGAITINTIAAASTTVPFTAGNTSGVVNWLNVTVKGQWTRE